MRKVLTVGLTLVGVMNLAGCGEGVGTARLFTLTKTSAIEVPGGSPQAGQRALLDYGCGACHVIPGVPGATGAVGPPLTGIANRTFIAGSLPNSPANLIRWIETPQAVEPGTAMPNLGVTEADARHIAAYLYTLQ